MRRMSLGDRLPLITLVGLLLAGSLLPAAGAEIQASPVSAASGESAPSGGAAWLLTSTDEGVSFEVVVPWEELTWEPAVLDGRSYSRLSIPGWSTTSEARAPALPFLAVAVGVPFGAELEVQVLPGAEHTISLPGPPMPMAGFPDATEGTLNERLKQIGGIPPLPVPRPEIAQDAAIYGGQEPYPGRLAEIVSDGILRQQRVVGVAAYPVQYLPASQEVRLYESLHVEIRFVRDPAGAEQPPRAESAAYEAILEASLLNYGSARVWRQSPEPAEGEALPWAPPVPGWRVRVQQEGLYRLTYDALSAAGLPLEGPNALDPRTLKLYNLGSEVAVYVEGQEDGQFNLQDSLLFYGQAVESKYTKDNIYWLTFGPGLGLRMGVRDGTPTTGQTPAFYRAERHMETDSFYVPVLPGDEDVERWLWDYVYPPSRAAWTHTFILPAPYDGSYDATLRASLLGYVASYINPDHHTRLYVNGSLVEDAWWDGLTVRLSEVTIPQDLLVPGENTVVLECPNDTGLGYDVVEIDWLELEFGDTFHAEGDILSFRYSQAGTWKYQVEGFGSADVKAFDISNPQAVVRIVGGSVVPSGPGYKLLFRDVVAGPTHYYAMTGAEVLEPVEIEADTPSDLQSPANGADYVLITPAAFWDQALALRDLRAGQGLRSVQVDLQDVYDEFGYGVEGAPAIREFLWHAYSSWQAPAPSYVVLMGDGHYDPKDHMGYGRVSYVPPYLAPVDPWLNETAADNRYVTVVGADNLPDMMLGRLAVNSPDDASAVVAKVVGYETNPAPGDWKEQVLLVTDNADQAGNFYQLSDKLVSCCLPEPYQAEKVYYLQTHSTPEEARAAILGGINSGKLIVNYLGHAAVDQWAAEGLLTVEDVPQLQNGFKLPVMVPMTCYDGYYLYPYPLDSGLDSVGETIVRQAGRGAVASWSPTGLGVSTGHDRLNRGFFDAVFHGRTRVLGQAAMAGGLVLWASGMHLELLDTYLMFGDPALQLDVPQVEVGIEKTVEPTTPVQPMDVVTFTLSVTNQGPAVAHNVAISDVMPAFVSGAEVVASSLSLILRPGTQFAWDAEDLAPGQSGTIVIRGTVDGAAGLGWHENEAQISTTQWQAGALPDEDSVAVLVVAGPPAVVQLSANPGQIPVGGGTSNLAARVTDQWGNPVADGTPVTFATSLGTVNPANSATFGGWAYSTLVSGTQVGLATVSATSGAGQGTTQVLFVAGPPNQIQVTASPGQIPVGGATSSVQALVEDAYGNPVADGTPVSFATTLGGVAPSLVPAVGGVAQTVLTSGTQAGTAAVSAQAGNANGQVDVTFLPGPPASISVGSIPAQVPAGGQTIVTATVADAWGNPVADGTPVQFSTTLGTVSPSTGISVGGQASTSFLAGTVAGQAWISASSGGVSGQVAVPVLPGGPAAVGVTALPPSIPLTGTATIEAAVADMYGNPVADGTGVLFATTLGLVTPSSATTMDGVAVATLHGDGLPGLATVTAQAGAASGSTEVQIGEGAPVSITLSADPEQILADGSAESTIAALVLDIFGQPITDTIPISFATTLGQVVPATTWVVDGVAVTHLSGTQAGMALVTASAANSSAGVVVALVAGAPAWVQVGVNPAELPVGGQAVVSVLVADAMGNAVADGTAVDLGTSLGTVDPALVTTVGGAAQSTFAAGWVAGGGVVTAVAGGVSAGAPVEVLPGPAASMSLSAAPPVLVANGLDASDITASLLDAFGNPVADGTAVNFQTTMGTVNPAAGWTNDGKAHTTLTAGTVTGLATVSAASGGVPATVGVELVAGPAATLTVVTSRPSMPADGQSQARLAATVADAFGNPVADGTWVTFGTTLGTISPAAVPTLGGSAESTLTSGTQAGTAQVTAVAGAAAGSTSVELLPGQPAAIEVEAAPDALVADGQSTSTVTVSVRDLQGNLVADGTPVGFAAELGSVDPSSGITHQGVVTTTFQAGAVVGTAVVTAVAGSASGATQLTLAAGPPGWLGISAVPPAIPADGASQAVVEVQVKDAWGHPVADGTIVWFSTTLGSFPPEVGFTVGGWAQMTLTSSTAAGVATVTAAAGSATGTVGVTFLPGPPAAIWPQADDWILPGKTGYVTRISAGVYDLRGNPVADGTPVSFEVSVGSISPQQSSTFAGIAEAVYIGVPLGGFVEVRATTLGGVTNVTYMWLDKGKTYLPLVPNR